MVSTLKRWQTPEYKAWKREYDIKYRERNKDKIRARQSTYQKANRPEMNRRNRLYASTTLRKKYKDNPAFYLWLAAKKRSLSKNIEFNIEVEDIVVPKICPILNIPIEILTGSHMRGSSLDRIDNNKGYIKGNVAVLSRRANRLKSDMSLEEARAILRYMENHLV